MTPRRVPHPHPGGRPRRVAGCVADHCATVRLTEPEHALVMRAARLAGLTLGGYLRSLILPHARTLAARRLPRWLPEEHVYDRPPLRVRDRRDERRRRTLRALPR